MTMFTQENPPKSGTARKLWDWFTDAEFDIPTRSYHPPCVKPRGEQPKALQVIRAGRVQRQAGAAKYEIEWDWKIFWIHDPAISLKGEPSPTVFGGDTPGKNYYL